MQGFGPPVVHDFQCFAESLPLHAEHLLRGPFSRWRGRVFLEKAQKLRRGLIFGREYHGYLGQQLGVGVLSHPFEKWSVC